MYTNSDMSNDIPKDFFLFPVSNKKLLQMTHSIISKLT